LSAAADASLSSSWAAAAAAAPDLVAVAVLAPAPVVSSSGPSEEEEEEEEEEEDRARLHPALDHRTKEGTSDDDRAAATDPFHAPCPAITKACAAVAIRTSTTPRA
jgi:hypothetical protein